MSNFIKSQYILQHSSPLIFYELNYDPVALCDLLCGLVVRVPGYRSRGPGSIPSAARFSEK
jgi:hypothetical protein